MLGLLFGIGYIVLFIGLNMVLGSNMTDMSTAERLVPFAASLAICAVTATVITTVLGWWPYVLRDRTKVGGAVRLVPIVWAIVIVIVLAAGQGWTIATDRLLLFVVMAILVGFSEELAYRGLTLVGFRGGVSEQRAWLFATILFALLHLPNALIGSPLAGAAIQTGLAFLGGTSLYMIRRTSGGIVLAMAFHGAWDFVNFINQNPTMSAIPTLTNVVLFVLFLTQWKRLFGEDQQRQLDPAA